MSIEVGDRLRVLWPAAKRGRYLLPACWYEGKCIDVQMELAGWSSKRLYHVKFDDGQLLWVPTDLNERIERIGPTQHTAQALAGMDVYDDQWEMLQLRCVLSHERLTNPAKGLMCDHTPCCNHEQLLRHQAKAACPGPGRARLSCACPVAGCNSTFPRSRDVRRDDALRDALASVPTSVERVWLQRGLHGVVVRIEPPATGAASQGASTSGASAATAIDVETIVHVPPPSEVRVKEEPDSSHARKRARDDGVANQERPESMAAAKAIEQARAEGLTLERSDRNRSGFMNVWFDGNNQTNPYRAGMWRDGKSMQIGNFPTAEQAALHVARAQAKHHPSAEEVEEECEEQDQESQTDEAPAHEAEGLRLHLSGTSSTGYRGVHKDGHRFRAQINREGTKKNLGLYDSALQAAVAFARAANARDATGVYTGTCRICGGRKRGNGAPCRRPCDGGQLSDDGAAQRHADSSSSSEHDNEQSNVILIDDDLPEEAGGLRLHLSSKSSTGYMGVYPTRPHGAFRAEIRPAGQLGVFDTAVEAAVAYARAVDARAAATHRRHQAHHDDHGADDGLPDADLISSRTRWRQQQEDMPVELSAAPPSLSRQQLEEQLSAARHELAAERAARQQLEERLGATQAELATLKRRLAAME